MSEIGKGFTELNHFVPRDINLSNNLEISRDIMIDYFIATDSSFLLREPTQTKEEYQKEQAKAVVRLGLFLAHHLKEEDKQI